MYDVLDIVVFIVSLVIATWLIVSTTVDVYDIHMILKGEPEKCVDPFISSIEREIKEEV